MRPSKALSLSSLPAYLIVVCLIVGTADLSTAQTLQTVHEFVSGGAFPHGRIIQGSDGFLYGTTVAGGGAGQGTVFRVAKDGSNFSQLKGFDCRSDSDGGCLPYSGLLEGSDGFLYGTTSQGGMFSGGSVFRIDKDGGGFVAFPIFFCFTKINCVSFSGLSGLIEGSDGFLYGVAAGGGAFGGGAVFRMSKNGLSFFPLKSFLCGDQNDGCLPTAALLEGSDGLLYGVTNKGGAFDQGTVFKVSKDSLSFTLLKSFQCSDNNGCSPLGELTEGSDGFLYGTTPTGTASGGGSVFKVAKDGRGFTALQRFECNSCELRGGVIEGSDGLLYGVTLWGGTYYQGTVFSLAKDGANFTTLKSFDCTHDGCNPYNGLTEGDDGFLYGTTYQGGFSGYGTVFRIAKNGSGFNVVMPIGCVIAGGCNPSAEVIEASDGFLYGTTFYGGTFNQGTVFKVGKDGAGFVSLKSFECITTESCYPAAQLLEGSDGQLYGTTGGNSIDGGGTLFRIARDGTGFIVLRNFHCGADDGCNPDAGLIEGSDSFLYGTTRGGGPDDRGTIFKIGKDGTGFTLLKIFQCGVATDGCFPSGELLEASDGLLYGTIPVGGAFGGGAVFKVAKDGTGFTLLRSFQCWVSTDACEPFDKLIEGSDGFLYGTAFFGQIAGFGSVFKIAKDGTGFAHLKIFSCSGTDPCSPAGGVVEGGDGFLYGATRWYSTFTPSAVFRVAKDGSGYGVVHGLGCDGDDPCGPEAGLTKASDGFLYGTTFGGGTYGGGTVYRLLVGHPLPNRIADLKANASTQTSASLSWTAPGNNGAIGAAKSYDVRFSTAVLDNTNWASAIPASGEPVPLTAGSAENFTVTGLLCGRTYYFGIVSRDVMNVASELSNVATAKTAPCNKLVVQNGVLPMGEVNVPYDSGVLNIAGGVAPYTVLVDPTGLPPGLILGTRGIVGTPREARVASFAGVVIDAAGALAKVKFKVTIVRPVIIATLSLIAGKVNTRYTATLKAKDGIAKYTWSVDPATPLPGTLVIEPSTGQIAGIVNVPTITDINFVVTDAPGAVARKTLRLTVK
jgi:uncharacterized repeat protein (TIGR03803 family)